MQIIRGRKAAILPITNDINDAKVPCRCSRILRDPVTVPPRALLTKRESLLLIGSGFYEFGKVGGGQCTGLLLPINNSDSRLVSRTRGGTVTG
ncbi:MAG: hypothetical protein WCR59_10075, partial [Planctomycetota bacterium]